MNKDERKKRIEELPDVFWRYKWNGKTIEKTCIVKVRRRVENRLTSFGEVISFEYCKNNTTKHISHPETINLGKYDPKRHCVFFKGGHLESDAGKIIQDYYSDQLMKWQAEARKCVYTIRDIQKFINESKKEGETQ